MTITIKTTNTNGHLIVYVINSSGVTILTAKDGETKSCMLTPGYTYRLEFHMWSSGAAKYKIEANMDPANPGFPPFTFEKEYDDAEQDMGGFYFTV